MSLIEELDTIPQTDDFTDAPEVNDDYQDAAPPAPIVEGNYRLRAEGLELDKDSNGNPRLTDGKWPVLLIKSLKVVEGANGTEGRTASSYERVYSKPFPRNGVNVSMLGDLSRAVDTTITFRDPREGISKIAAAVENGATIQARVIWEGYDKDYYDQLVAAEGGESMCTPEQKKKFRKDATTKGMKNFPMHADGTRSHIYVGKSGQTIEGRSKIGSWYPSNKSVKIG